MTDVDRISGDVLDLSIRLHRDLGPGLLESVYEMVLAGQFARMGYGATLKEGFRRLVNGHGLSAPPRLCANSIYGE